MYEIQDELRLSFEAHEKRNLVVFVAPPRISWSSHPLIPQSRFLLLDYLCCIEWLFLQAICVVLVLEYS